MNIEFLRIIFTIIIIIYHFIRKMGFDCNGCYAVEFFFVLSGYMLAKYSVVNPKYLSTCDYIFQKIKMFYPYIILGCIECYAFDPDIVKVLNTLSFSPNISNLKLVVC